MIKYCNKLFILFAIILIFAPVSVFSANANKAVFCDDIIVTDNVDNSSSFFMYESIKAILDMCEIDSVISDIITLQGIYYIEDYSNNIILENETIIKYNNKKDTIFIFHTWNSLLV